MMTMKQPHMTLLIRPGASDLARKAIVALSRSTFGRVAVCALVMQCPASVQAEDAPPTKQPDAQSTLVQKPADVIQGRQMARYKAFARQAELPWITATNNTMLEVGGMVKTDTTRLAKLSAREREALAGQFGVPVAVIDKLVQRAASNSTPTADQFAQELRTAVVDYKFLQIEWQRYHPPAEGQKTKAAGLEALQAGDISKAWELYDGLRKPQAPAISAPPPPANLRIVNQQ